MTKNIYKFDTPVMSVDANAFSGTGKVLLPKSVKIITNIENSPISFVTPSGKITESKNEIPHNEIWYKASKICDLGGSTIPIQESTEDNEFGWKRHIFSEDLIEMPAGVFGDAGYSDDVLEKVLLSESITSIGNFAFCGCYALTSVSIPNSVTSIGDQAFKDCYSLTSITIPNSVTSIGSQAFIYCRALVSITIPNSVTSIRGLTFAYCDALTSITLGSGVTSIRDRAFYGRNSLTTITCEATTPPTLGSYNNLPNVTSVYVPAESVDLYKNATNWSYYSGVIKPIE